MPMPALFRSWRERARCSSPKFTCRSEKKPTRSSNAITFDGGQGQGPDGIEFRGEITRFASDGRVDRAVGRAKAAYGGALTKALREIVYVRPGLVVVYDELASAKPRAWEWNLHALERMDPQPDGRVAVAVMMMHAMQNDAHRPSSLSETRGGSQPFASAAPARRPVRAV